MDDLLDHEMMTMAFVVAYSRVIEGGNGRSVDGLFGVRRFAAFWYVDRPQWAEHVDLAPSSAELNSWFRLTGRFEP